MNIIVLGPQGSGKSTHAEKLAQKLDLPLLDMGSFLRAKAELDSIAAEKIREIIEKGQLLDDETLISLLKEELADKKYSNGVVMDGAPRTLAQARLLENIVKIDKVFYLTLPDSISVKRLLDRGRQDDTPELIKKRLELYHESTHPALDYFKNKGILEEIDASASIEQVYADIEEKLNND